MLEISEIKKKAVSIPKFLLIASPIHVSSVLFSHYRSNETFYLMWIIVAAYLLFPLIYPKKYLPFYYLSLLLIKHQEKTLPKSIINLEYWSIGYNPRKPSENDVIQFNKKQFFLMLILWFALLCIAIIKY